MIEEVGMGARRRGAVGEQFGLLLFDQACELRWGEGQDSENLIADQGVSNGRQWLFFLPREPVVAANGV